jgi:uncharacterized protein
LIPVGNSLLYIRPFYAQGRGSGSFPQFQFVAVFTQDFGQAVCAQNVNDALNQLFGQAPVSASCNLAFNGTGTAGGNTSTSTTTTTTLPGTPTTVAPPVTTLPASTRDLITLANQTYQDAQTALKAGDFATYGTKIAALSDILAKLDAATR